MDEAEIAVGGFVVAGSQSPGIFEFVEAAFDHVAQSIDCGIDGKLDQPVSFGRDHRDAAALFHVVANEVSVIALVSEEHSGRWPMGVHDRPIALIVGGFAARQGKGYGQAQRIDAEMDLGRKATF